MSALKKYKLSKSKRPALNSGREVSMYYLGRAQMARETCIEQARMSDDIEMRRMYVASARRWHSMALGECKNLAALEVKA